ncbi:MAG: helix-turn-helix transcriptional regulator [Sneathiella sp.]|uniref:PadR family transcriptional regulator n=1 Tax=Sneathiella sp. TaxID=1964365 RepID=UPI003001B623
MTLKRSSIPMLGLLTWRPMSGYELKQEIEGSLENYWSESFGQLYPHLRELHRSGLIEELKNRGRR